MNYNKIKFLADQNKITLKQICAQIDITEQGLQRMFSNNSMKIDTLEKIATVLNVPVAYFFSEEGFKNVVYSATSQAEDAAALRLENSRLLKEISDLKTKIIQLLEKKG